MTLKIEDIKIGDLLLATGLVGWKKYNGSVCRVVDIKGEQIYFGIPEEIRGRLTNLGGGFGPAKSTWGSKDPKLIEYWKEWGATQHRLEEDPYRWADTEVRNRIASDPELLKYVFNELVVETGVELLLHSWISSVIKEGETVKGVIIENKSGSQAILGKVLVDATGDGDIMAWANAEFARGDRPFALAFRVGNVDIPKARAYIREKREEYLLKMQELKRENGFWQERFFNAVNPNVILFFNMFPNRNPLDVKDLTAVEIEGRKKIVATVNFYKKNIPGFERSFLLDTASQIGIRESRKLLGEYVISKDDVKNQRKFDDVVAKGISYIDYDIIFDIPYRSLLPRKIDNLLVTGRALSMDHDAFTLTQALIVQCFATGEAAGTAAAISAKEKVSPRIVDVSLIQKRLKEKGIVL